MLSSAPERGGSNRAFRDQILIASAREPEAPFTLKGLLALRGSALRRLAQHA